MQRWEPNQRGRLECHQCGWDEGEEWTPAKAIGCALLMLMAMVVGLAWLALASPLAHVRG
jgi:hypothetical protein